MGLIATTVVPARPGDPNGFAVFGPDDDVPEWAARQMGAHLFENGEHPFPDPATVTIPDRVPGTEPTRSGPGSSRDAWVAFASEQGFPIPADAKNRDQIIEAMTAAGVIGAAPATEAAAAAAADEAKAEADAAERAALDAQQAQAVADAAAQAEAEAAAAQAAQQ